MSEKLSIYNVWGNENRVVLVYLRQGYIFVAFFYKIEV